MKRALILLVLFLSACQVKNTDKNYLFLAMDTITNRSGYLNLKGDTVISFGKYLMCFTDTFKTFAIVAKSKEGFVAIDRYEKVLFKVFPFDNGPDYPSEGYFRIIGDGNKMGYADTAGKVIIKPRYGCAFPFEHGKAQVSDTCTTIADGEHRVWQSANWYHIDKNGRPVK